MKLFKSFPKALLIALLASGLAHASHRLSRHTASTAAQSAATAFGTPTAPINDHAYLYDESPKSADESAYDNSFDSYKELPTNNNHNGLIAQISHLKTIAHIDAFKAHKKREKAKKLIEEAEELEAESQKAEKQAYDCTLEICSRITADRHVKRYMHQCFKTWHSRTIERQNPRNLVTERMNHIRRLNYLRKSFKSWQQLIASPVSTNGVKSLPASAAKTPAAQGTSTNSKKKHSPQSTEGMPSTSSASKAAAAQGAKKVPLTGLLSSKEIVKLKKFTRFLGSSDDDA